VVKTDLADIRSFTTDVKRIQTGTYSGIFIVLTCHVIPVGLTWKNETAVKHNFGSGLG
jgi:hypothetical protein